MGWGKDERKGRILTYGPCGDLFVQDSQPGMHRQPGVLRWPVCHLAGA